MRRIRGLVLDAGATKAVRVLRARLGPLGYDVRVSPPGVPDVIVDGFRLRGYVIVTTDRDGLRLGWVYIPLEYAGRKSARDLASHITKIVFGGAMSP